MRMIYVILYGWVGLCDEKHPWSSLFGGDSVGPRYLCGHHVVETEAGASPGSHVIFLGHARTGGSFF